MHDDNKIWKMIDWSGNTNFTILYGHMEEEDSLQSLKSDVSIPITDDHITSVEI